jgi:hypothetical protein
MLNGKTNKRPYSLERVLVRALAAYLRLALEDLRAQYLRLVDETNRLKKLGGAVDEIQRQLANLNVDGRMKDVQASSNRRLRSAAVRAAAGGKLPTSYHSTSPAPPVARKAANSKADHPVDR